MHELVKIIIFNEKEIIFISVYITLSLCCTKFEVHYLLRAAKFI